MIAPDGVRNVMERMEGTAGLAIIFVLVMVFGTVLSKFTVSTMNAIWDFFCFIVGIR